jgi:hypothetical protein
MIVVPSPAAPTLAPPLEKNVETPLPPVPVIATELAERPAIPLPASPPHIAGAEPEPSSKPSEVQSQTAPAALPDSAAISERTALVVNAVEVPKSEVEIPDAAIAGNFSVIPSKSAEKGSEAGASTGVAKGEPTGIAGKNGISTAAETNKDVGSNNGSSSGITGAKREGAGSGDRKSGAGGRVGNGSGSAARAGAGGPGAGTGTTPRPGNGNFPGITIMGGTGGGRSRSSPRSRPGYELTIVSGGSSGGASRDLGVFGRDETVYTVYISMSDAGGGADWSMQYAEIAASQAGNGLLTPPLASKKVSALLPSGFLQAFEGPVFVSGVIAEDGTVHQLHAIQRRDVVAKMAVETLSQWEFLPAQLKDKPVAIKVLIGVVMQRAQ